MKYLTVIWAIVILAMACLPCADEGAAFAQGKSTTVQADDFHQDGAQDEDLCSPLCECNCCGGITLISWIAPPSEPQPYPQSTYRSAYLDDAAYSPEFPFWHPPKV
ncbi:hypothetical protein C8N40_11393 [Pontibacter mucosus]|uniref:Secreted protein n=1 Tax=Pontibacter mucosus TaxID=1649266 RepID=A0A2T5Y9U7_9BACT|nr:DUF6660 family protein [Pontibacter mucosus]PTX13171.1 hypothetical protein C8N40_11393 [Pontibacter mucosus]